MADIKMEDIIEKPESTSDEAQVEETNEVESTEQDPLKTELEKVQRTGRTELEKATFSLKKNAERLKELGGDPNTILGIEKETLETEDDKPVTLGMLKKIQQENAAKSALQMAEEINNETERELVKYHLQTTIKSTGIPAEDLKIARAIVNSVKNSQITEELGRKPNAKTHSSSSGVDAKQEKEVVFTSEELRMMSSPFNVTKDEILAARQGKKFSFPKV